MSTLAVGMNEAYQLAHSEHSCHEAVEKFRQAIEELDCAVASAYGWDDIDLDHAFLTEENLPGGSRVRYTISEDARAEILRRLSQLNRQRHEEEVGRGLCDGATPRASSRATRTSRILSTATVQPSLDFESGTATTVNVTTPTTAILDFLRTRPGWYAKADVLTATGITDGQWNAAISDLIAAGTVERQGEKRGARYRFVGKAE